MRKATIPAVMMFACSLAHGQTFDAASVKPAAPPDRNGMVNMGIEGGPGTQRPGRIEYRYLTMQTLLTTAYGVKTFQLSGPVWLDTERFDIVATLPPDATKEQLGVMLQNVLTARFKMTLHRESKVLSIYSLAVAKGGPKMKQEADVPEAAEPENPRSRPKIGPDGFRAVEDLPASAPIGMIAFPGRAHVSGRQKTMQELAERLTIFLRRPVIDATALNGKYDIAFTYAPDNRPAGQDATTATPDADADADALPDIFGALQSQLGLKLEPKKSPIEIIVIDHIEKTPIEN
jgi:uncharacterized protein (TIGR03435 family)